MKKDKLSLYQSLFSLITAFVVLICVCVVWFKSFAWFTDNPSGKTNNIVATTKDPSINSLVVESYYLSKTDDTDEFYVIGDKLTANDIGDYEMHSHNDINHYTPILMKVTYNVSYDGTYGLSLTNNTNEIYNISGDLDNFQSNYLSNAIGIHNVTDDTDITNSKVYIDYDSTSFLTSTTTSGVTTYTKSNSIEITSLDLEVGEGVFYFIIDYEETNINYLYNVMLENYPEASLLTTMTFSKDLTLVMKKY